MKQKSFKAHSWLKDRDLSNRGGALSSLKAELPPELPQGPATDLFPADGFRASKFLTPGWTGDGLISKVGLNLKKSLMILAKDAQVQLEKFEYLNRSLKLKIYQQFLNYAHFNDLELQEIDDFTHFWKELNNPNSLYVEDLKEFKHAYSFQTAVVYLFKVRFLFHLSEEMGIPFQEKHYLNPSSFFARIFAKGSRREIDCDSLKQNEFSWYRPRADLKATILKLVDGLQNISITEVMKIATYLPVSNGLGGEEIRFKGIKYSHSLSHLSLGIFINQLLLDYPKWLGNEPPPTIPGNKRSQKYKIYTTKYTGNHLPSLTQSHWLAQQYNVTKDWKELICPDFISYESTKDNFLKFCHELQFLVFLLEFAKNQQQDPMDTICQVMRDKYSQAQSSSDGQMNMFSDNDLSSDARYKRIVLNLTDLPKKNPHHFLITQITNQLEGLATNGKLLVLTGQNLFVPSQSERMKQFLKNAKIESILHLDRLKGKGEIGPHVYIISKRSKLEEMYDTGPCKESCPSIRISGELGQFNQFQDILVKFDEFMEERTNNVPLFQTETKGNISFEFFKDAILDGKLMHSSSNDPSNITHPNFFRNLTSSSLSLDQFFQIESLSQGQSNQKNSNFTEGLLGISLSQEKKFPFVLIINRSNSSDVRLEIIHADSYRAKFNEYGNAFYHYFGLLPKSRGINIDLFRIFFETPVGHQIVQLSLSGATTKLKSKVRALLIPQFLVEPMALPQFLQDKISVLDLTEQEILGTHPDHLDALFREVGNVVKAYKHEYPSAILQNLHSFQVNLEGAILKFESGNNSNDAINFNNPLFIEELVKLPTYNLYPQNEEIFVEFLAKDRSAIRSPLRKLKTIHSEDSSSLTLLNSNGPVVILHSKRTMITLTEKILNKAIGAPISSILHGLQLPQSEDLERAINKLQQLESKLVELSHSSKVFISDIFNSKVSAVRQRNNVPGITNLLQVTDDLS